MAARELGLDNRPWLKLDVQVDMVRCFACGSLRNPEFPICATCKNIDMTTSACRGNQISGRITCQLGQGILSRSAALLNDQGQSELH
jgi:hypothetical protein